MNFYKCSECQSVVMELVSGDQAEAKTFQELHANATDASGEKHVPVIAQDGDKVTVTVGEIEHPMLDEHYIMWIFLETEAVFCLCPEDKPVVAYAYCNLHGLWKAEWK